MRTGGILQPVIVRPVGGSYELVAGERRLRAARLAELSRIPAVVRVLSDEQAVELSLVENIQREDLNPLEQARAFERLSSEFALTQDEIARRTGKDRTTVANMMRLLRLPADVQVLVEEGRLTAGHARALLKLEDSPALQRVLAKRMAARRVSVRQAEEMVDRFKKTVSVIRSLASSMSVRKKVYFEAIHGKMKTFSPESMAIFALETAGGINLAQDAEPVRQTNIAAYGKERILSHAHEIDVYLAQSGAMNRPAVSLIRNEPGFHIIKAVKNNQIFIIDEKIVSRPTMRLLEGIYRIGSILYPDVFTEANRTAMNIPVMR